MDSRVSTGNRRGLAAVRAVADAIERSPMGKVAFLRAAVRDFHHVGTLWPSSHAAARQIAALIGPERRYVVEYGAGDGVVSKEIMAAMPSDGRLLALEINEEFCDALTEMADAMGDDRLLVRQRDIVDFVRNGARELPQIDAVVSGIPLSFHSAEERAMIVRRTRELLAPNGVFVVYQVSPIFFPAVKREFPKARLMVSLRNLPPYFICIAEK